MVCTLGRLVEHLSTKGLLVIKYGKKIITTILRALATEGVKSPDQILLSIGLAFF